MRELDILQSSLFHASNALSFLRSKVVSSNILGGQKNNNNKKAYYYYFFKSKLSFLSTVLNHGVADAVFLTGLTVG